VGDVKVYDGLTDYVASAEEAERLRQTLYRTDASARATVLPVYRPHLEAADLERFHVQGYLAMEGVLAPEDVAQCAAALDDLACRRPEGIGAQDCHDSNVDLEPRCTDRAVARSASFKKVC